jgi:hypothetical protein
LNNSDKVTVERQADGGFKVTVTDKDGVITHFTIPTGFMLNLFAHAPNVTFKSGGQAPEAPDGEIDGFANAGGGTPQRTSPTTNGADGVPTGGLDLGHDLLGGAVVVAGAVDADAGVVDDDARALLREEHGHGAADAASATGHDCVSSL